MKGKITKWECIDDYILNRLQNIENQYISNLIQSHNSQCIEIKRDKVYNVIRLIGKYYMINMKEYLDYIKKCGKEI